MLNDLQWRRRRYELETMCVDSGQGVAAIFEHA
jgi:acetyl-CoA acetyltransferase